MFNHMKEAAIIWLATQKRELNRTVLNKLIFFIDVVSYLKKGNTISEDFHIKKPYGPVPSQAESCRSFLLRNGLINESWYNLGQYGEYGYQVVDDIADVKKVEAEFNTDELKIIYSVINKLSGFSASYLSEITHIYEPWKSANWEEQLDFRRINKDKEFQDWLKGMELI